MVLVDAQTGAVLLHLDEITEAKNRIICDARSTATKVPCTAPYARVEGGAATGIADVDLAYLYAGGVYDFLKTRFNRDSIDNQGMPLVQTVRFCPQGCPFENAYWNGRQMVYGPGFASADDVVGHEMMHGVTERTSHLFYWFQSGAINESLSDIFGELFDLSNGLGTDTAAVRWKLGENLPGGAIRDMRTPGLFGDPDRMTSPDYNDGFDGFEIVDSGGVHSNSGVNNKAAALLTDGGTFNGRTVLPLGLSKVALLYYEVDANILSSGSDYQDLYDGLYQACQNLVAIGRFKSSDCTQVRNATLAVEMNLQPHGDPASFPSVPEAPMCPTGQVPADLFYDNMENTASGNWARQTALGANSWIYDQDYAPSGRRMLWSGEGAAPSDASLAMARATVIPTGRTTYIRFSQANNFEAGYDDSFNWINADGGVIEYSANGGAWTDLGSRVTDNGYTGVVSSGNGNPLSGRGAFVGATGGTFSTRVNLSGLAGQAVKVRFRLGTDQGNFADAFWGWTVDDVRIYTCSVGSRPAPSATTNLLRNGGFEWDDNDDGYADAWTRNLGALRTPGAQQSGRYGLSFTAADNERYVVAQRVAVTAGTAYRAAASVKIPTTTRTVSFSVRAQYRNSAGTLLATKVLRTYTTHTSGLWNTFAVRTVAPTGATSATFMYAQNGLDARVMTDNASFRRY